MVRNPFTPTFGVSPPTLVGRDNVLDDVEDALSDGVGSPGRATLITGMRGVGKTVVLNAIEDRARERGWVIISDSTRAGLIDELTSSTIPDLLARNDPAGWQTSTITSVSGTAGVIGGGVSREVRQRYAAQPSLRLQLTRLLDLADEQDAGVLITLDEVHLGPAQTDLREFAQVLQHLFREGRQVSFVGAGLPHAVDGILKDDVLTFLRRADRHELGVVSDADVVKALADPIRSHGREISSEALDVAVAGIQGYPFMVQLVGHHMWRELSAGESIGVVHAEAGVAAANRRVGRLVHEPSLKDLSQVDRNFLSAMTLDDGPSKTSDVAARLGVSATYANVYRTRLLAAQVITKPRYGFVDFALPHMRDYLRSHADLTVLNASKGSD